MLLSEKVAIVTGAASGIGSEIARVFGANGASIVVNYRSNEEGAKILADEIEGLGGHAAIYQADVSEEDAAKGLMEFTYKKFGRIDVLVNNAGATRDGLLINMSVEDWDYVLANNLRGPFLCAKYAIKRMMRQRSGKVINITSIGGILGNAGQANYASSKAGLIGLTKTIAKEYSSKGITANAIAPGVVQTKMMDALPEEKVEDMVQWSLLKRAGTTNEIAQTALFLASSMSNYINGEVLRVDGGSVF